MSERHDPPPLDTPPHDDRDGQGGHAPPPVRVPLPEPSVKKSRWPFPIVWIVPLLAAVGTAYYLSKIYNTHGVEIAISLNDASNIRIRDTPLNYHGVRVGSVSRIDLTEARDRALVFVRLEKAYQDKIARAGGAFWVVRPGVDGGMLDGLSTVITGPYLDCNPGTGDRTLRFDGQDARPVLLGDGLKVVLHTDRLSHLDIKSPVFFRGLQVGTVQDIRFASDATGVNVTIFVWKRYAKLLRPGSRFWQAGGTEIRGGLLEGVSIDINNVKALLAGGVAFATPPGEDRRVVGDGADFVLHDAPEKEWLTWTAKIVMPEADNPNQTQPGPMPKVGVP